MKRSVLAGLDIGTHQITAVVGQPGTSQPLEILGLRVGPTRGLAHGVIVDLGDCVDAIARVVRQVEEQAATRITTVTATMHGPTIRSHNTTASITLPDTSSEISRWDVDRVLAACRTAAVTYDRQLLHEFIQQFAVDDQDGVRNPVGLFGGKLEAQLHVVTAQTSLLQSWRKVLNHAGLEVSALLLPGVATSFAVLTELDRDLGAIVVDIGGVHTDIVCCVDGAVRETMAVPWGGDRLTERLAERFHLPLAVAEQVKLQCNSIEPSSSDGDTVRVPTGPGASRAVPRADVVAVLAAETQELFAAVRQRLEASRYFREAAAGLVMTGGTALMAGVLEQAETACNLPVRLGGLHGVAAHPRVSVTPTADTAIGLLAYQLARQSQARTSAAPAGTHPLGRLVHRAKALLEDYF